MSFYTQKRILFPVKNVKKATAEEAKEYFKKPLQLESTLRELGFSDISEVPIEQLHLIYKDLGKVQEWGEVSPILNKFINEKGYINVIKFDKMLNYVSSYNVKNIYIY